MSSASGYVHSHSFRDKRSSSVPLSTDCAFATMQPFHISPFCGASSSLLSSLLSPPSVSLPDDELKSNSANNGSSHPLVIILPFMVTSPTKLPFTING